MNVEHSRTQYNCNWSGFEFMIDDDYRLSFGIYRNNINNK